MAKTKRNSATTTMYKVTQNVKLVNGESSILLDENTPQDVLAEYAKHEVGKGFIELVVAPAATQTQDDAEAGQ